MSMVHTDAVFFEDGKAFETWLVDNASTATHVWIRMAKKGTGVTSFDWTTASHEELLVKFGVLNAVYLPGVEGEATLPEGLSLVNTYPEILRRYHGLEVEDLPDRVYGMVNGNYFNLIDITERVDEAFEELLPR